MSGYWYFRTCEGSSKAEVAAETCHLHPFRVWQAKQLVRRDVAACLFMFFASFTYMYKTLPEVCSGGLGCSTREQYQAGRQDHLPCWDDDRLKSPLWQAVCRGSHSPLSFQLGANAADAAQHSTKWLLHVSSAVRQPRAVLAAVTQAGRTFLNIGRLSRDPLHLVFPPLCIIPLLLLLLPHPHINPAAIWRAAAAAVRSRLRSSVHTGATRSEPYTIIIWYLPCYYWQQPLLRTTVVLLQRLLVYIAAASCVGRSECQYLLFVRGLRYWGTIGKFAYLGWVAYILMLPMPIHLPVSCCEWLIGYLTILRINALAHGSSSSSDDYTLVLQRYQLPISMLLAIVLPTLAVVSLEKAHRKLYNKMQQKLQQMQLHSKAEGPGSSSSSKDLTRRGKDLDHIDESAFDVSHHMNTTALQLTRADSLSPMQGHAAAADGRVSGSGRRSSSSSRRRSNARRSVDPIGPQFLADISGSLQLAANHTAVPYVSVAPEIGSAATATAVAAAPRVLLPTAAVVPRVLLPTAAAAVPDEADTPRSVSDLGPKVTSLLADEAAEVFAAAARCQSP